MEFGKFDHWGGEGKPIWKFGRSDTQEVIATCLFKRELRPIQDEVATHEDDEPLNYDDEVDYLSVPEDTNSLGLKGSVIVSYPSSTRTELLRELRPLGRPRTRAGNRHWVTITGRIGGGDDPRPRGRSRQRTGD